jgi:DNA repair exonuclease SbcCD ATPase subunit
MTSAPTADTKLALTRIRIENFRGYGSDFDLQLAAPNGVTILSGPNGLGKTSLYEAIEWALTGSVRRLALLTDGDPQRMELIRRESNLSQCHVELTFEGNDGRTHTVFRDFSRTSGLVTGTPVLKVVELLSGSGRDWGIREDNLTEYLLLTHIHPQSAPLRLVARPAGDRWTWISRLAGTQRFETIRSRLQGNKRSFTRLRETYEERLSIAKERLAAWRENLNQLAKLQEAASLTTGALQPRDAIQAAATLAAELSIDLPFAHTSDPVARLSVASTAFELALEASRRRLATLESLVPAVTALRTMTAEAAAHTELHRRALHELSAARSRLVELELQTVVLKDRADAAEADYNARREEHATLIAALAACEQLTKVRGELAAGSSLDAGLSTSLNNSLALEAQATETLTLRQRISTALRTARAQEKELTTLLGGLSKLSGLESEVERYRQIGVTLRAEEARIAADRNTVSAELIRANDAVARAEKAVSSLQASAEQLLQAVSIIAGVLDDDEQHCPVCRTEFSPGALRKIASQSVARTSPKLASLQGEVASARATAETLVKLEAQITDALRTNHARQKSVNDAIAPLEQQAEAILRIPQFREQPRSLLEGTFSAALSNSLLQVNDLLAQLSQLESDEQLASRHRKQKNEAAAARQSLTAHHARTAYFRQQELDWMSVLQRAQIFETDAELARRAAEAATRSAEERLRVVEPAYRAARTDAEIQQAAISETRAKAITLQQNADRLAGELKDLSGRSEATRQACFKALGRETSHSDLDEAIRACNVSIRAIEDGRVRLKDLSTRMAQWRDTEVVQQLQRRLETEAGAMSLADRTVLLENEMRIARNQYEAASRGRTALDELGDALRDRTSAFNELVLTPIDVLFKAYLRALIHDDRYHQIGLQPHTRANAGSLTFQLDANDAPDGADAELLLSEGQVAELSLAALFAASSAYQWSCWPALMLDDPTQYNDLVHATALFEVVRNLAAFKRYQIIMSTHDHQQARFYRRKLEASGVPWTECRFLSSSASGIEFASDRS